MEKVDNSNKNKISRREFIKWLLVGGGLAAIAYKLKFAFTAERRPVLEVTSPSETWQLKEFYSIDCPIEHTPDAAVSVVAAGERQVLFTAGGDSSIRVEGDPLKSWKSAEVVAQPSRLETEQGEAGYLGISSVVPLPDGTWLGFAHAEFHDPQDRNEDGSTSGKPFKAEVQIMTSQDQGKTWSEPVTLVAGSKPDEVAWQTENRFASGAGQPSAVVVGDEVVLYFTDWNGHRTDEIYQATAPLAEAANPDSWQVNTNSAALRRPSEADSYAALPCVIQAKAWGTYLATFETAQGFYLAESADGKNWGEGELVLDRKAHPGLSYPSVMELEGKVYFMCAKDVGKGKQHKPIVAELQKRDQG